LPRQLLARAEEEEEAVEAAAEVGFAFNDTTIFMNIYKEQLKLIK